VKANGVHKSSQILAGTVWRFGTRDWTHRAPLFTLERANFELTRLFRTLNLSALSEHNVSSPEKEISSRAIFTCSPQSFRLFHVESGL